MDGDHAVLAEQAAHRVDVQPVRLELEKIGHGIVAVRDVDDRALEHHLVAPDRELAGVGVQHPQAVAPAQVARQLLLLVRAVAGVLGLDEADVPAAAPDDLQVIGDLLQEELADVDVGREPEAGIAAREQWEHLVGDDAVAGRPEVQPADAGQVGLEEPQGLLPHRAREVDDRVEPTEHRVDLALAWPPALLEPPFLVVGEAQHVPHRRIGEVEIGESLERVLQREGRVADVRELLGEGGQRSGQDADDLDGVVAQVDQAARARPDVEAVEQGLKLGLGQSRERPVDAPRHPRAAQAQILDGCPHEAMLSKESCRTRSVMRSWSGWRARRRCSARWRPPSSGTRRHTCPPAGWRTGAGRWRSSPGCSTSARPIRGARSFSRRSPSRRSARTPTARRRSTCASSSRRTSASARFPARWSRISPRRPASARRPGPMRATGGAFAEFAPHLERIVALKRAEASCLAGGGDLYDALLDDHEEGMTTARLHELDAPLRAGLGALLDRVRGAARRPDPSLCRGEFPIPEQRALGVWVGASMGFDFERGRLDDSVHPFTTGLGPGDCRITARWHASDLAVGLFAVFHEVGHGLYEQGLDPSQWGLPAGEQVSDGIDESQSRLWENLVGRSPGFWRFLWPELVRRFPALAAVGREELYRATNRVEPSLVRAVADEVTYNLHVFLRVDLERALLAGDLAVRDLPAAWNEGYRRVFGLSPSHDGEGCLQDGHWAAGLIGYFPSYTLGDVYAAEIGAAAERELGDLDAAFARGELRPLRDWLVERIYRQGCRWLPGELIARLTGAAPGPAPLLQRLGRKVEALYR